MKKVLFITPWLCQGGIEHSLITALENIDSKQYDVTLYLYKNKLDLLPQVPSYVKVIFEEDRTKYFRLPVSIALFGMIKTCQCLHLENKQRKYEKKLSDYIHQLKVLYPLKHGLKNMRFDTVVSYSVHICSETALKIPASKHVIFIHSSDPEYHQDITSRVLHKYDHVISVSEGVKKVIDTAFPAVSNKSTVLRNYVDANRIIQKSSCPVELRKRSAQKIILCSCGRLSEEKGYDLAVEAAYLLKKDGIDFLWYFVGDGNERASIEKQIKEKLLENNIIITGYQENPYPFIRNCNIFVQPSYQEAYPLVLIETMILGKPIVSTDTIGGRTILKNGKAGILTEISSGGLKSGICKLLYDGDLRHSFENQYTPEDDLYNKDQFINGLKRILDEKNKFYEQD